jgi:TM2 domain-containing membrane protein YozV
MCVECPPPDLPTSRGLQVPKATDVSTGHAADVVDLKDPVVAAILGWMIPGLGHLYQGRTGKGLLFMICILSTFFFGLFISDGKAVYAWWSPDDWRLPYLCQLGVGLPATPALVQSYLVRNGKAPLFGGVMAPPVDSRELDSWYKELNRYLELGIVYTMIAGLLNVLAIYDAWGGPVQLEEQAREKRPQEQGLPTGG